MIDPILPSGIAVPGRGNAAKREARRQAGVAGDETPA
jgi:hypothetical protein